MSGMGQDPRAGRDGRDERDASDRLDPELDRDLRALFGSAARPYPPASLGALLDDLPPRPRSGWRRVAGWRPRNSGVLARRAVAVAAVVLVVVGAVNVLPSLRLGMTGSASAPSAAGTDIAGGPTAAASAAASAAAASQAPAASVEPSTAATQAASASAAASTAASEPAASASASTSSGALSPDGALAIARAFAASPGWSPAVDSSGLASPDPVYVVSGDGIVVRVAAATGRVTSYTNAAWKPAGGTPAVPQSAARTAATTFLVLRGVDVSQLPSVASAADAASGAYIFVWRTADSSALAPVVTVYVSQSTGEVYEFTDVRP